MSYIVGLLEGKSLHDRCHDPARVRDVSKFRQVNAWGCRVDQHNRVDQVTAEDLEAREWNGDQPCHVPRLSSPSVIGMEMVEPRREAFVWETLLRHGYQCWFELWIWVVMLHHLRVAVSKESQRCGE